jgi:predicted TIM-barrel fold metal-dependent hydrolase
MHSILSFMNSIPIFDSLTHPTFTGEWLTGAKNNASLELLLSDMKNSNTRWAFAVGMKGIGQYNEQGFAEWILSKSGNLFPVAYIDPKEPCSIEQFIKLKKQGYIGIKLHPRLSDFSLSDSRLIPIIKQAHQVGLIIFLCTYFYDRTQTSAKNNIESLVSLLASFTDEKIILLHSGAIRVLELVELTRAFKNILLDISFTLVKYEGSSLDVDIKYLFQTFDRRICIGSDFPEFSQVKMRERFEYFAKDIAAEKLENIAYKNIVSFTGINI